MSAYLSIQSGRRTVRAAARFLVLRGPVIFWDVALPGSPPSYGFGLPGVYAIWLTVIAALYPVCRWYGARAHRR